MAGISTPLPPAIEAAHRLLADNEPMSAADLSDQLRATGFHKSIEALVQLPDRYPDRFRMMADGRIGIGSPGETTTNVVILDEPEGADWYRPATRPRVPTDRIAVLDIETTGLDPSKDFIWEIALVGLNGEQLAHLPVRLPEGMERPSSDDADKATSLDEALRALDTHLKAIDLVIGQNALAFDFPFLDKAAK